MSKRELTVCDGCGRTDKKVKGKMQAAGYITLNMGEDMILEAHNLRCMGRAIRQTVKAVNAILENVEAATQTESALFKEAETPTPDAPESETPTTEPPATDPVDPPVVETPTAGSGRRRR